MSSNKKKLDISESVSAIVDYLESQPEEAEQQAGNYRKGLDVTAREYKTKRVQLLLKPSIYEGLRELSEQLKEETGNSKLSINEIVNQILENFLKGAKEND